MLKLLFLYAALVGDVQPHIDSTVMVDTKHSAGSGVVFVNGKNVYVWTDAHVVEDTQKVKTVVDRASGTPRVLVTYRDVKVLRPVVKGGRKVGGEHRYARVIRYSQHEDLALLRVYDDGWLTQGATFATGPPSPGEALWHVGCHWGEMGMHSVSDGVVASVGRIRSRFRNNDLDGIIYDQVSMTAHEGSSGGGIFRKTNGECLGLVTEFLGSDQGYYTYGSLCVTPARRLRDFAKRNDCLWAVDGATAPPKQEGVITDDDIGLPEDWPQPAPAAAGKQTYLDKLFQLPFTLN